MSLSAGGGNGCGSQAPIQSGAPHVLTVSVLASSMNNGLSTLCQLSRVLEFRASPEIRISPYAAAWERERAFSDVSHETMRRAVYQGTLSCHAYRSEDVVARTHHLPDACLAKFLYRASCCRLQFVLENDETYEIESALGLLALHFLYICPGRTDRLGRTSYDAETAVSVEV